MQYLRFLFLNLVFILLCLAIGIHYKVSIEEPILIEIQKGYSSKQISELLEGEELIINNFLFNFYTRIISNDKSIKAGEYLIDRSESIYTLIFKLTEGDNFQRKIILLPGSTLQEIYSLRQQRGIVDDLGINPAIYLNEMSIPFTEGVFFPDTFFFEKGEPFSSILKKSHNKWLTVFEPLWVNRKKNLPYENIMQAITLASIIEKEGLEKEKIASVFVNRLKKNMKLQSDPTVIYALGKDFDGDIKKKDLRIDNPYNTYKYKGLPPGPISIVSESSFKAALNPEDTDYLYFVSMGNGLHKFSKNLREHNQAVLKYQINAR